MVRLPSGEQVRITWQNTDYMTYLDAQEGETWWLVAPLDTPPPQLGTMVVVEFGQKSGYYRMPMKMLKIEPGNVILWGLQVAGEIEKIQRRGYFRVDVSLNGVVETEEGNWPVFIGNLSASGCRFNTEKVPVSDFFRLSFVLGQHPIELPVSVRNRVEIPGFTRLGVEFKQLSRQQEDAIIRYCNAEELKRRRRGLS